MRCWSTCGGITLRQVMYRARNASCCATSGIIWFEEPGTAPCAHMGRGAGQRGQRLAGDLLHGPATRAADRERRVLILVELAELRDGVGHLHATQVGGGERARHLLSDARLDIVGLEK